MFLLIHFLGLVNEGEPRKQPENPQLLQSEMFNLIIVTVVRKPLFLAVTSQNRVGSYENKTRKFPIIHCINRLRRRCVTGHDEKFRSI